MNNYNFFDQKDIEVIKDEPINCLVGGKLVKVMYEGRQVDAYVGGQVVEGGSKWMPLWARTFINNLGLTVTHHFIKKGDVVGVLAITEEGEIAVTCQSRAGSKKMHSIEVIAGRLQKGKTPLETAIAETYEEAGCEVTADTVVIENIPYYYADQAGVESRGYLYIFDGVKRTNQQHLDEGEDVKVHFISKEKVIELVKNGIINDANSRELILWAMAFDVI